MAGAGLRSTTMTPGRSPYIYVSGPLQAANDLPEARRLYELVAGACRGAGWEVYLPHQQTDPVAHAKAPAASVFAHDYKKVREAALIIAHIGAPSSGVGAELGIAFEQRIPVITMHRAHEQPSRFIAGMIESAGFPNIVFRSEADCTAKLRAALNQVEHLRGRHPRHLATASVPRHESLGEVERELVD